MEILLDAGNAKLKKMKMLSQRHQHKHQSIMYINIPFNKLFSHSKMFEVA
jgi:hypothetical protein